MLASDRIRIWRVLRERTEAAVCETEYHRSGKLNASRTSSVCVSAVTIVQYQCSYIWSQIHPDDDKTVLLFHNPLIGAYAGSRQLIY